jgi:hypothetical protein
MRPASYPSGGVPPATAKQLHLLTVWVTTLQGAGRWCRCAQLGTQQHDTWRCWCPHRTMVRSTLVRLFGRTVELRIGVDGSGWGCGADSIQVALKVTGMSCECCVEGVQSALEKLDSLVSSHDGNTRCSALVSVGRCRFKRRGLIYPEPTGIRTLHLIPSSAAHNPVPAPPPHHLSLNSLQTLP